MGKKGELQVWRNESEGQREEMSARATNRALAIASVTQIGAANTENPAGTQTGLKNPNIASGYTKLNMVNYNLLSFVFFLFKGNIFSLHCCSKRAQKSGSGSKNPIHFSPLRIGLLAIIS